MPLPPIPLQSYTDWATKKWTDATQAVIDATPLDNWALDAGNLIQDTFTQARQPLAPPEPPPPPPPPPEPEPVLAPPLELQGPPSPDFGQRAQMTAQSALGGLGEGLQGAAAGVGDWASSAQEQIAGLGSSLGSAFAPDPEQERLSRERIAQDTLAPGLDVTQPSGVTAAAPVAPPPGVEGAQHLLGGIGDVLNRVPNVTPMGLGADLGASLAAGAPGRATELAGAAGDVYRREVLEPGLADQARTRAEERQLYEDFLDRMYADNPAAAPAGERRRRLVDTMQFNADVGASVAGSSMKTVAPARGRVVLGDIPELLSSIPLASPTSLAANLTSGLGRSLERVAGKVFEGRPVEAIVDLGGMVRELPGAARRVRGAYRAGATPLNPGMTGATTTGDLATRGGLLPEAASAGVKANAATDQFWRDLNEAGAGAAARYRRAGPVETARMRQSAGDFATFTGPNSQVAKKLTEMKAVLRDPDAPFVDKASAWAVTSMAPYVMMPERLLRATVGALVPAESAYGFVKAVQRGDRGAARELAGRAAAGLGATTLLTKMYLDGAVTGDAPTDANERRRREAQGEQWNTVELPGLGRVPARYLGSLGMQANAVATTLDAAREAQEAGGDPGAVLEAGANGAARWVLSTSYLSDLVDFADKVKSGGFTGALRQTAAGQPSRLTAPVTGIINAADPYDREAVTFPEQVAARTGLRALVPPRIDPVTGEAQRRAGSGWSRYWGERGTVPSDEATELARLTLQPRVLSPNEDYAGEKQTPEQRRVLQQALGSETGKAVRETLATPAYQQADDAAKKSLLQAALRRATDEADIVAGGRVARNPKSQAQREWDAVPKFVGVQGTPDEIRRENARIQRAMTLASKYRAEHGEGGWRSRMSAEAPDAYALINTPRRPAPLLTREREKIEARYEVSLG